MKNLTDINPADAPPEPSVDECLDYILWVDDMEKLLAHRQLAFRLEHGYSTTEEAKKDIRYTELRLVEEALETVREGAKKFIRLHNLMSDLKNFTKSTG